MTATVVKGSGAAGRKPAAPTFSGASSEPQAIDGILEFIHGLKRSDVPDAVSRQAWRCLLDLAATAVGGTMTEASRIVRRVAAGHFGAGSLASRILFDGRRVSPTGAALAGAATIDSLDGHDGHPLTKGHSGVTVLPALVAMADATGCDDGDEFLAAFVMGYEVAIRAGIALHRTASDYHTSGAWNAIAAAAIGARSLKLDPGRTREALGIAEYNGPRSQMMRCIDHPTMVKDGSGWGAMTGITAALLAADGFSGAPAVTLEGSEVMPLWSDLGRRWRMLEQYFKPYPVCRWAHPAVEAVLSILGRHGATAEAVESIEVTSFHEAVRLATREPRSTDEAQYSLPFAVAAAAVRGRLGAAEVVGQSLTDPDILRLSRGMRLGESDAFNRLFPAERWATVTIRMVDGRRLRSQPSIARGNPENPLSDAEIAEKFDALVVPVAGRQRAGELRDRIDGLGAPSGRLVPLLNELTRPL